MFLFQKVFYIISSCCSWYLWYMSALIHILIKYNSLSMQKDYCYLYIWDEETRKRDKRILIKGTGETKIPTRVHVIAKPVGLSVAYILQQPCNLFDLERKCWVQYT